MLQVVVYAGAIMVLFLFVLMLLNVKPEERTRAAGRAFKVAALALGACSGCRSARLSWGGVRGAPAGDFDASTRMARVLFSPQYLYVFEATSVLILAALVGAVVLAKKDL